MSRIVVSKNRLHSYLSCHCWPATMTGVMMNVLGEWDPVLKRGEEAEGFYLTAL